MTKATKLSAVTPDALRRVLPWLFVAIALYVFLPQIGGFSSSVRELRHAHHEYFVLAVGLLAGTFLIAAGIYKLLAKHLLSYGKTLIVQLATGFTNRLLPAGIGSLGLNALYLRSAGHTTSEAVSVVGVNNLLGFLGHIGWLVVVVAATDVGIGQLSRPSAMQIWTAVCFVAIAAVTYLLLFRRFRERLRRSFGNVFRSVAGYGRRPLRLVSAYGLSLLLTAGYVLILWVSARAVGVDISVAKIFVVFTAGMLVGTLAPTPGGLIGVETGLAGSLVAYGASSGEALAVTLLYRLATYWLPLIPGFFAFRFVRRHYL